MERYRKPKLSTSRMPAPSVLLPRTTPLLFSSHDTTVVEFTHRWSFSIDATSVSATAW